MHPLKMLTRPLVCTDHDGFKAGLDPATEHTPLSARYPPPFLQRHKQTFLSTRNVFSLLLDVV
jgi:hypothetical protein